MFDGQIGTVLSVVPPRTVKIWWDGEARENLVIFDQEGYALLWEKLSAGLQPDIAMYNVKSFLNKLIDKYDFYERGPIHLNAVRVKKLLGIK